jgi:2-desacetyl-2-hydroxyethyl bacteriochlorophyllide A dehydrogenase
MAETIPWPQPGKVLVQTHLSAISAGTELLFYRGEVPPDMAVDATLAALGHGPARYPLKYGYACVGHVAALGEGVRADWLGRRVFAFQPHASAFVAEPESLIPIPDGVPDQEAVLLPNMETAVNFVMDGAPLVGEKVVVVGLGVVGLLTTALLATFPLAHLAAVDPLPARRQLALTFGARGAWATADAAAAGGRAASADLTYEVSGSPAALDTAIALTGFAGRIVIGSWYGQKRAPIDLGGTFHRSRIRLMSSQVSTVDPALSGRWDKARRMEVAWDLLRRLDVDRLISHHFPIAEAAAAYQLLDTQPAEALQVLLTYPAQPPGIQTSQAAANAAAIDSSGETHVFARR